MNGKQFSEVLHDISKERVPEDMDLWNEIKTQAKVTNVPPSRGRNIRQRRMIILAAVLTLIMSTMAVWAQGPGDGLEKDQGLQDVDEAGLLIELNETKTQNDVSVTLEYAYADVNRISIAYSTMSEVSPDMHLRYDYNLTDVDGNQYLSVFGGGGGGGGGTGAPPETVTEVSQSSLNFDVPAAVADQESIDLILTVSVDVDDCAPYEEDCVYEPEDLADLTFEFNVELYQGIAFDVDQTITANDIEIELLDGVITPSATRIVMCHEPLTGQFLVSPELRVNGDLVTDGSTIPFPPSEDLGPNCRHLIFTQSLMDADGEWELTFPSLVSVIQPEPQEVVDYLVENGIDAQLTEDGNIDFETVKPSDDMTQEEFGTIMSGMPRPEEVREGEPWVFSFDVEIDAE